MKTQKHAEHHIWRLGYTYRLREVHAFTATNASMYFPPYRPLPAYRSGSPPTVRAPPVWREMELALYGPVMAGINSKTASWIFVPQWWLRHLRDRVIHVPIQRRRMAIWAAAPTRTFSSLAAAGLDL